MVWRLRVPEVWRQCYSLWTQEKLARDGWTDGRVEMQTINSLFCWIKLKIRRELWKSSILARAWGHLELVQIGGLGHPLKNVISHKDPPCASEISFSPKLNGSLEPFQFCSAMRWEEKFVLWIWYFPMSHLTAKILSTFRPLNLDMKRDKTFQNYPPPPRNIEKSSNI